MLLTFFLTNIAWIYFRAQTIGQANDYLFRMFTLQSGNSALNLVTFPFRPPSGSALLAASRRTHDQHRPGARDHRQEPRQLQALRELRHAAPGQEGLGRGPRAVFALPRSVRLPLTRSLPTRATSPFASGAAALALFSAYATEHALTRRWNDLEPGRGGQGA